MDIKKVIAKLPTGFVDEAAAMGANELRQCILRATATIQEVKDAQEADEKLQGAKELVKDYSAGYTDVVKAQGAKVAYCLHLLAERGQPAPSDSDAGEDP